MKNKREKRLKLIKSVMKEGTSLVTLQGKKDHKAVREDSKVKSEMKELL